MSKVNPRLVYWIAGLYDGRFSTAHRDTLVCLATRHLDYADGSGYCSIAALAADTGLHESTVRRALTSAQAAPERLHRTSRGHRLGNGEVAASGWQLVWLPISTAQPCTVEPISTAQETSLNRAQDDSQPCTRSALSEVLTEQPSSSARAREADIIRRHYPNATEWQIDKLCKEVAELHHPRNMPAYLSKMAANGSLPPLPAEPVGKPPWCGKCDDHTRMTEGPPPRRCPNCHPLAAPVEARDRDGTTGRAYNGQAAALAAWTAAHPEAALAGNRTMQAPS